MKIMVQPLVAENSVRITIECPQPWLNANCEPLPTGLAELITTEQGIGIIQDAVIMAMGYQKKES